MKNRKPENGDELPIRNSTAEFLVFAKDNAADTIAVRFQDRMLWLTLQLIADLFDVSKSTVSEHLTHIYAAAELDASATVRKFRTVRQEGRRQVERQLEYYNLEAIIAVGYRVNSSRATQFRRWATGVLRDFALRGYVLDRKRMENGAFLDKILSVDDRELLTRASEISAEIAQAHAFNEYEKFRVRQELEYKNDFDRQLDWLEEQAKKDDDSPAHGK